MKYIRVSEVLARLQNFSKIEPAILEAKAEIGTNVHKMITNKCLGMNPQTDCDRTRAYYDSYVKFHEKNDLKFVMLESRFNCDNMMITGEMDALVKHDNELMILDWKTSATANPTIWNMQAHFYYMILRSNNVPVSSKMHWVQLRQKKVFDIDDDGTIILDLFDRKSWHWEAMEPKVYEFTFCKETASECVLEAEKCWDEKRRNFDID